MRALSRSLGVSHAAPANHFSSKEELFLEIAREGFAGLGEAMLEAAPTGATPIERLTRLGRTYLDFASSHPSHFAVMFRSDLYDRVEVEGAASQTFEMLVDACQSAQASGWRADQDPRAVATLLWSVVHGLAHLEAEGVRMEATGEDVISLVVAT